MLPTSFKCMRQRRSNGNSTWNYLLFCGLPITQTSGREHISPPDTTPSGKHLTKAFGQKSPWGKSPSRKEAPGAFSGGLCQIRQSVWNKRLFSSLSSKTSHDRLKVLYAYLVLVRLNARNRKLSVAVTAILAYTVYCYGIIHNNNH